MHPVLSIFGYEVPSYALMIAIGYIVGLFIAKKRRKYYKISRQRLNAAYLWCGVGAFIGGKTFSAVQNLGRYLNSWQHYGMTFAEYIAGTGLVFYGGMIGTFVFMLLAAKILKLRFWSLLGVLLPSLPLAQAFGRIGCFLAGCCYGIPVSWGVYMDPIGSAPSNLPLLPIQLFEAAGVFIIFLFLYFNKRAKEKPKLLLAYYLIFYGFLRMATEVFRYDSLRGIIGSLSVSQWFSIGGILMGMTIIYLLNKSKVMSVNKSL